MLRNLTIAIAAVAALAACQDKSSEPEPPEALVQEPSRSAQVKFKGGVRIASDLSRALEIPRAELCKELSSDDCLEVHRIVLGGVEPYRLSIYEPVPTAPVAAPLAVERLALSSCGERAARDFESQSSAVLFGEVAAAPDSSEVRKAAVAELYRRLLQREARAEELTALVALYDQLMPMEDGGRVWAQLSCMAIATTTEFLFY